MILGEACGEGAFLVPIGLFGIRAAKRLQRLGYKLAPDVLLWPVDRSETADWWKLEAKMQEKRA